MTEFTFNPVFERFWVVIAAAAVLFGLLVLGPLFGRTTRKRAILLAAMRAVAILLLLVAMLRPTQNYVHLAARGLTMFDIAPGRVARDLEQWQGLCRWLDA